MGAATPTVLTNGAVIQIVWDPNALAHPPVNSPGACGDGGIAGRISTSTEKPGDLAIPESYPNSFFSAMRNNARVLCDLQHASTGGDFLMSLAEPKMLERSRNLIAAASSKLESSIVRLGLGPPQSLRIAARPPDGSTVRTSALAFGSPLFLEITAINALAQ